MFNKITLIGRLGQKAEAKTAQNNCEFVVLSVATQESWKTDKGDHETRTEWHRVYAWGKLSSFACTLERGQLITLEGHPALPGCRNTPSTASSGSPRFMPPASSGFRSLRPRTIQQTAHTAVSSPREVSHLTSFAPH